MALQRSISQEQSLEDCKLPVGAVVDLLRLLGLSALLVVATSRSGGLALAQAVVGDSEKMASGILLLHDEHLLCMMPDDPTNFNGAVGYPSNDPPTEWFSLLCGGGAADAVEAQKVTLQLGPQKVSERSKSMQLVHQQPA